MAVCVQLLLPITAVVELHTDFSAICLSFHPNVAHIFFRFVSECALSRIEHENLKKGDAVESSTSQRELLAAELTIHYYQEVERH